MFGDCLKNFDVEASKISPCSSNICKIGALIRPRMLKFSLDRNSSFRYRFFRSGRLISRDNPRVE